MLDTLDFVATDTKADSQVQKMKMSQSAREIVRSLAAHEDMTMEGIAGRMVEWFTKQPEVLQKWILGQTAKELQPVAAQLIAEYFTQQARPAKGSVKPGASIRTPSQETAGESAKAGTTASRK